MEASLRWDTDNDGIIDNAGFADQTYDAWTVTGARCVGSIDINLGGIYNNNNNKFICIAPYI